MFALAGLFSLVMGVTDGSFAQENLTSSASSQGTDNLTSSASSQGTDNLSSTSFSASNLTTAGNTSSPSLTTGDNTTTSTTDRNAMQNGTAKEASGPLDTIMNFFK
jgi:hypothetical protein